MEPSTSSAAVAAPPTPSPHIASPRPPLRARSDSGSAQGGFPSLAFEAGPDDASMDDLAGDAGGSQNPNNKASMYVREFNNMLDTVLAQEGYLFLEPELNVFARYKALSYNAQYLLVRLLLRVSRIHRFDHLDQKYASELGPHLAEAMDELSAPFPCAPVASSSKQQQPATISIPSSPAAAKRSGKSKAAVIDLTGDSDEGEDENDAVEVMDDPELTRALRESVKTLAADNVRRSTPMRKASFKDKGKSKEIVKPLLLRPPPLPGAASSAPEKLKEPASLPDSVVAALSLDAKALNLSCFASAAEDVDDEKLLRCLKLDELKDVAKGMKVLKPGMTYEVLVQSLLKVSRTQSTLAFPVLPSPRPAESSKPKPTPDQKGKTKSTNSLTQSTLSFKPKTLARSSSALGKSSLNKASRLSVIVRGVMGKALVINDDIRTLWQRLNLIFYRSTVTPPTLLLPQILTIARRRTYPSYACTRTLSLFPSRAALIQYEQALLLETEVDDALGEQETLNGRRPFSKKDLAAGAGVNAPAAASGKGDGGGGAGWGGKSSYGNTIGRKEGAQVVVGVLDLVLERWKTLVKEAKAAGQEGTGPRVVSDRFQPGHVLTRIVYKGAAALGVLHEYDREIEVLQLLLDQKVWRRGRRGAWYERKALILMTHYKGAVEKKEEALEVATDGLLDEDTHLIYRPSLTKRLARLEKMLKLPEDERHQTARVLKLGDPVILEAPRIRQRSPSVMEDETGNGSEDDARSARGSTAASTGSARSGGGGGAGARNQGKKRDKEATTWGVKSAWMGRMGGPVGVEQWVLEHWEDKGYKGFHAEGSIMTTLFGLLFWDILFAPVPGAFETSFQSAPLDLGEDSFALARGPLMASRLAALEAGEGPTILSDVDDRERPSLTMCVGVRWEFGKADLVEIVECIGGKALAVICRLLAEDYGQRNSGVPDLIVWQHSSLSVRWIEVKGPGDSLRPTQCVWIDVLQSAGVAVEVCRVDEEGTAEARREKEAEKQRKRKEKAEEKARAQRKGRKKAKVEDYEDEEMEEDDEGGDEDEPDEREGRLLPSGWTDWDDENEGDGDQADGRATSVSSSTRGSLKRRKVYDSDDE